MKSELELVREFSELNEAKVDSWGALPASSEKRFRELKAYFEDLMARRSTERIPLLDRHETFGIGGTAFEPDIAAESQRLGRIPEQLLDDLSYPFRIQLHDAHLRVLGRGEGLGAAARRRMRDLGLGQHLADQLAKEALVVHDEDVRGLLRHGSPIGPRHGPPIGRPAYKM